MQAYLTTAEVAEHLRIKERKVYELVRRGEIPVSRATGKLLFPRQLVDLWVMEGVEHAVRRTTPPPPVVAGSHDPLLDWALRAADTDLAVHYCGSGEGMRRLADGQAVAAGLHLLDPESGEYNRIAGTPLAGLPDLVVVCWAWRRQGLVVAPGNPLGLGGIEDLVAGRVTVVPRQPEAGAQILLRHCVTAAGGDPRRLRETGPPAASDADLAAEVRTGRADCGVAAEAAARAHGLEFLPLATERFDLALSRRAYFEPPIQRLFAFARDEAFRKRAAALGGYDVAANGTVIYNA